MIVEEYFIKACQAGMYRVADWVISVFSMTSGDPEVIEPYALVSDPTGYYYFDENLVKQKIVGSIATKPLLEVNEELMIKPGDIPNLQQEIRTSYGNLLGNWIVLVYGLGSRIPYINDRINIKAVEDQILKRFESDPENEEDRDPEKIYVSDYLNYTDGVFFLTEVTQVFTVANTEKNILPPDGLKEYRQSLLDKYRNELDKPEVVAMIDRLLIEFDAKWRGNDEGNKFLDVSGKAVKMVRRQKFLMVGNVGGLGEVKGSGGFVGKSLYEGIDTDNWEALNDTLRGGSYGRGQETMLSGVDVKWLERISSGVRVIDGFCGTKVGRPMTITKALIPKIVGFSEITAQGQTPIDTEEQAGTYLGKTIMVSSPMFCIQEGIDRCGICMGARLRAAPDAASKSLSNEASIMMNIFMAKMHGTALETVRMDPVTTLY